MYHNVIYNQRDLAMMFIIHLQIVKNSNSKNSNCNFKIYNHNIQSIKNIQTTKKQQSKNSNLRDFWPLGLLGGPHRHIGIVGVCTVQQQEGRKVHPTSACSKVEYGETPKTMVNMVETSVLPSVNQPSPSTLHHLGI